MYDHDDIEMFLFQEKRIYDLKKKNQELEKFKFVLDYKIKELKKQIEPRESDINNMKEQIQEVSSCLNACEVHHEKTCLWDFRPGPIQKNQTAQLQKMLLGLKFWI